MRPNQLMKSTAPFRKKSSEFATPPCRGLSLSRYAMRPMNKAHLILLCGIIADNLSKAGWSLGWVSAVDCEGRTIWIVDAHGYGKRFIVRAEEIVTAFLELETAIQEFAVDML
jgi:hypothetical protein